MFKYIFLIVFIVLVCVADPSSFFLDENTLRLLYRDDDDDADNADDSVTKDSNKNDSVEDTESAGLKEELDADSMVESVFSDDDKAPNDMSNLQSELEKLQQELGAMKGNDSGPSDVNVDKIQEDFVEDIYEEWSADGSTDK